MNTPNHLIFTDWLILSGVISGVIFGVFSYSKLPLDLKYLAWYFFVFTALELAADYRMVVLLKNNLVFYHISTLFYYFFFSMIFRENIPSLNIKKIILISIFFVVVCEIILVFTIQGIKQSPSWIRLVARLFLLVWAVQYLISLLNLKVPVRLLTLSTFWICIGLLISFISFFQVGLMRHLISIKADIEQVRFWYRVSVWFEWGFHLVCTYPLFQIWRNIYFPSKNVS